MHMCYGRGVTPQAPFSCERQGVTLFCITEVLRSSLGVVRLGEFGEDLGEILQSVFKFFVSLFGTSHGLRVHLSFGLQALGLGLALSPEGVRRF